MKFQIMKIAVPFKNHLILQAKGEHKGQRILDANNYRT